MLKFNVIFSGRILNNFKPSVCTVPRLQIFDLKIPVNSIFCNRLNWKLKYCYIYVVLFHIIKNTSFENEHIKKRKTPTVQ